MDQFYINFHGDPMIPLVFVQGSMIPSSLKILQIYSSRSHLSYMNVWAMFRNRAMYLMWPVDNDLGPLT